MIINKIVIKLRWYICIIGSHLGVTLALWSACIGETAAEVEVLKMNKGGF
jgi:hypothetical protein